MTHQRILLALASSVSCGVIPATEQVGELTLSSTSFVKATSPGGEAKVYGQGCAKDRSKRDTYEHFDYPVFQSSRTTPKHAEEEHSGNSIEGDFHTDHSYLDVDSLDDVDEYDDQDNFSDDGFDLLEDESHAEGHTIPRQTANIHFVDPVDDKGQTSSNENPTTVHGEINDEKPATFHKEINDEKDTEVEDGKDILDEFDDMKDSKVEGAIDASEEIEAEKDHEGLSESKDFTEEIDDEKDSAGMEGEKYNSEVIDDEEDAASQETAVTPEEIAGEDNAEADEAEFEDESEEDTKDHPSHHEFE